MVLRMEHFHCNWREGEDGDIVLLAEVLSSCCKRSAARSAAQQVADTCEAEEPALSVLRLGHAIRHEHHRVPVGEAEVEGGNCIPATTPSGSAPSTAISSH